MSETISVPEKQVISNDKTLVLGKADKPHKSENQLWRKFRNSVINDINGIIENEPTESIATAEIDKVIQEAYQCVYAALNSVQSFYHRKGVRFDPVKMNKTVLAAMSRAASSPAQIEFGEENILFRVAHEFVFASITRERLECLSTDLLHDILMHTQEVKEEIRGKNMGPVLALTRDKTIDLLLKMADTFTREDIRVALGLEP